MKIIKKKSRKLDILAALTYFFQGCLGLVGLAIPLYYKSLGFTVAQIATIAAIAGLPWYIKIIFGMITDNYPIAGYRRKPYVIISSIISAIGWLLLLVNASPTYVYLILCGLLYTTGYCLRDVVVDAKIAEHSKNDLDAKHFQVISMGYRALGAVITGVLGGLLVDKFGYFLIFRIMLFVQSIILIAGISMDDVKVVVCKKVNVIVSLVNPIKEYVKNSQLRILSLFLFLGMFSPGLGVAFLFYMKQHNISTTFLGVLGSVGSASAVAGAILYNKFFKKLPIKKVLYTGIIIGAVSTLLVWFYYIKWFAILDTIIFGVIGMILYIPLMTLFMKLAARTKHEGTTYAIVASISNLTGAGAGVLGGWLFDKIGFLPLILISSATTFVTWPIIKYFNDDVKEIVEPKKVSTPGLKPITIWERYVKKNEKITGREYWDFEHNHIEDGHVDLDKPKPKSPLQMGWKNSKWRKTFAYLDSANHVVDKYGIDI